MPLQFTLTANPSPQDRQVLEDGLYEFNRRQVGKDDGQLLAIFLRDAQGEIVAGLSGWTWAGACQIQAVWVHPDYRGQGCGRRLMQAAEEEARARGAGFVVLSTYDFQAHVFYQKLGYEVECRIEDFPPGHSRLHLRKQLA